MSSPEYYTVPDVVVVLFSAALILTTAVLSCLPAHLRLPAAWRHPVVRPDSDRQLLAHPPVSAEPAGAVSGCRYGPMREPRACSDR
ncbi:TPA: hypothetical protein ACGTRB_005009, partial [Escherichia coli]